MTTVTTVALYADITCRSQDHGYYSCTLGLLQGHYIYLSMIFKFIVARVGVKTTVNVITTVALYVAIACRSQDHSECDYYSCTLCCYRV